MSGQFTVSAEARRKAEERGEAREGGSWPIRNKADLKNAIQAIGRAKPGERLAVKRWIIKRARELNAINLLPESWNIKEASDAEALASRLRLTPAELALGAWFNRENWIEQTTTGHLPNYIRRIADHLMSKGMAEGHAIASAVNTVKRWARGGTASKHGGGRRGQSHVKPDTIAKAIMALAEWELKKAQAHANAAETRAFAASTAEDIEKADAMVPPEDVDTLTAVKEGLTYLQGWLKDPANAADPVFDEVQQAVDLVSSQMKSLSTKAAAATDSWRAGLNTNFAVEADAALPTEDSEAEGQPDSLLADLLARYSTALSSLQPVGT